MAVNKSVRSAVLVVFLLQILHRTVLLCVTCGFLVPLQSMHRLPADTHVLAVELWKLA